MTWSIEGRSLRAVLVTRLRYLGDIVMSTVVLDALKRGDPGLSIDFLCEAEYMEVLADHPQLDRLYGVRTHRKGRDADARSMPMSLLATTGAHRSRSARGVLATLAELRRRRYDLCVDLFFNPRSAWLVRLSGSRWRVGGSPGWRRRFYTHTVLTEPFHQEPSLLRLVRGGLADHLSRLTPLHHVESGLPFLSWLLQSYGDQRPVPRLPAPDPMAGGASQALANLGIPSRGPFVLLVAGATWPSKEWPQERWSELIDRLQDSLGWPLVVLMPPVRSEGVAALAPALSRGQGGVLPPLSLPDALRVVALASLVVAVDGGLMHASVGLARPTLALFGPTDPGIWFPYADLGPYRVLCTRPACHPCDRHVCTEFVCLPQLTAAEVADQARALLQGTRGVA